MHTRLGGLDSLRARIRRAITRTLALTLTLTLTLPRYEACEQTERFDIFVVFSSTADRAAWEEV